MSALTEADPSGTPEVLDTARCLPSESGRSAVETLRRWGGRLLTFCVGQGMVQMFNLLAGFLLIRWLSVSDYAVYSLATGFQGTAVVLVELGLGSSIVALLAGRTDPKVVGGYIRSARRYRNRFFLVLLPAAAVVFPIMASRQGMNWLMTVVLLGAIMTALYFESWTAYYSIPLIVQQKLADYYRTPSLVGAGRLALSFILYSVSALNGWVAAWTNSIAIVVQGWLYRREAAQYIEEPRLSEPTLDKEIMGYIRPLVPSVVFFALQGQINIFLISWFGHAQSVAEVGALGRLGQLFVMLAAFNSVVIAPNIAQVPRKVLASRYGLIVAGALIVSCVFLGVSIVAPQVLLWILGEKYSHLRPELTWIMVAASLGYINGVMWTMHAARKWIFRWGVWAYIVSVLAAQAFGVAFMDLSTTGGVVRLSALSAMATLAVQVAWAFHGFVFHDPVHSELQTSTPSA